MSGKVKGLLVWLESTYFPNHDLVGYGYSSFDVPIVTHDPYRYSPSRLCIYGTIVIGVIYFSVKMYQLYEVISSSPPSSPFSSTKLLYQRLIQFAWLSIVASGIHHFDNFWRIDDYYLASWIYNGHFFILDIGIANWVVASFFALTGVQKLLFRDYEKRLGLIMVYIHCVMIWSGQLHYSIEPIFNFSTSANISILSEGAAAIAFHIFAIWYSQELLIDGPDRRAYKPIAQSEEDINKEIKSIELTSEPKRSLRRRSRDSEDGI